MIIMESYSRSGVHDFTMASRKAEEASKFSIYIFPPIHYNYNDSVDYGFFFKILIIFPF
jgi:hypothetical protein